MHPVHSKDNQHVRFNCLSIRQPTWKQCFIQDTADVVQLSANKHICGFHHCQVEESYGILQPRRIKATLDTFFPQNSPS